MSIQKELEALKDAPPFSTFHSSEKRFLAQEDFFISSKEANRKLDQLRVIGLMGSLEEFIGTRVEPFPETDDDFVSALLAGNKFGLDPWVLQRDFSADTSDLFLTLTNSDNEEMRPVYIEFNGKALEISGFATTFNRPISDIHNPDILDRAIAKALTSNWRQPSNPAMDLTKFPNF